MMRIERDILEIDVEPGGVIVVGPKGRLRMVCNPDGEGMLEVSNCDFIGTEQMSAAHRALVDERWRLRAEDGSLLGPEMAALEAEAAAERVSAALARLGAGNTKGPLAAILRSVGGMYLAYGLWLWARQSGGGHGKGYTAASAVDSAARKNSAWSSDLKGFCRPLDP